MTRAPLARLTYSLDDVATLFGVSVRTLEREIHDGRLAVRWLRGQRRVSADEVARYHAAMPQKTQPTRLEPAVKAAPKQQDERPGRVTHLVDFEAMFGETA